MLVLGLKGLIDLPMILQSLAASESVRSLIFFLMMSSRITSDMALSADDAVLWEKERRLKCFLSILARKPS